MRGQNYGQSTDTTSQTLPFAHPEFSVIIEMNHNFFSLEQMEKSLLEIP